MAWFRNLYRCDRCQFEWHDGWSCMCDVDCPECGARHISPYEADELTEIIARRGDEFVVCRSPDTAGDQPEYEEVGVFPTLELAGASLNDAAD
jgi:hypothetical protein